MRCRKYDIAIHDTTKHYYNTHQTYKMILGVFLWETPLYKIRLPDATILTNVSDASMDKLKENYLARAA